MLQGKQVIAVGERDGVSGPAIAAVAEAAGAKVAYMATECFVWTASGAMDLHTQEGILKVTEKHDKDDIVVLLGAPDPEAAEIAAETVVQGDPSFAGCLAETQLGLAVYHVLEDEVKADVPDDVWEDQIGVMSDVLDTEALKKAVEGIRAQA